MMTKTQEKELQATVEQVSMTIEDKWLLDCFCDLEDGCLNVTVCYTLAEVEVFDGNIVGMDEDELLDTIENNMVSAFLDFDLEEEKIRHGSDIDSYDALDDDNKEYKKIAYLISRQNHGASWKQIKFESVLIDNRTWLGESIAEETNPAVQALYINDLTSIVNAPVLYSYMQSEVDPKKFIKVMQANSRINTLCELGKLNEAKKEFLETLENM